MSEGRGARPLCPSAPPHLKGAVAIGVVGGTVAEPRVRPLEHPVPVTDDLLALAGDVRPTEVFRFAAPCLCQGCAHFGEDRCGLAAKVVRLVPPVQDDLPECDIRSECRWYGQEGPEACRRCPSVVTDDVFRLVELRDAADPRTPVPQ